MLISDWLNYCIIFLKTELYYYFVKVVLVIRITVYIIFILLVLCEFNFYTKVFKDICCWTFTVTWYLSTCNMYLE